ncbi:MAG: hypothetical protein JJU00_04490 [Opitutales bacterium]|nr:hypothetical protein [Opitutales bacterium]
MATRKANESAHRERSIKEGYFLWVNKAMMGRIRGYFDGTCRCEGAISIYVALCEIASDEQSETFEAIQGEIGMKAGVSAKTVGRLMPQLEKAGVVSVFERPLKTPKIYTLLSPDQTNCPNDQTNCPNDQTTKISPMSDIIRKEESEEEGIEESPPEGGRCVTVSPSLEDVLTEADRVLIPADTARRFHRMNNSKGWRIDGKPLKNWRAALRKFAPVDVEMLRQNYDSAEFWQAVDEYGEETGDPEDMRRAAAVFVEWNQKRGWEDDDGNRIFDPLKAFYAWHVNDWMDLGEREEPTLHRQDWNDVEEFD